jgi:hypothetical protein
VPVVGDQGEEAKEVRAPEESGGETAGSRQRAEEKEKEEEEEVGGHVKACIVDAEAAGFGGGEAVGGQRYPCRCHECL